MDTRYPQQRISVFDIFKVGVGPSSSHTMGPWRAAERFVRTLVLERAIESVRRITVDLYGSLAKTGIGHGTDVAVVLGLSGEDPETVPHSVVDEVRRTVRGIEHLALAGGLSIGFEYVRDIRFHHDESLDYHPNGLRFSAALSHGRTIQETYYSIGGGFVVQEDEIPRPEASVTLPYPIDNAADILRWTRAHDPELRISELVRENERTWDPEDRIDARLMRVFEVMRECVFNGLSTERALPGGLGVARRARGLAASLLPLPWPPAAQAFFEAVANSNSAPARPDAAGFERVLRWISAFALAVNEENADFGRVVTAPTNGAAGVVPAVLLYYRYFVSGASDEGVVRFLLTAGEIGSVFKKGATISAAQGGCQAEIGVSSAMAAAGLTEVLGGNPEQVLMAAEIAMEHHLGLTCDPVGGLVQVPCIERNTMGAVKAITGATLALAGDPSSARVSLDDVIEAMWNTALDMNTKYKETSEGGLAARIPINVIEC
ncbi:MAG: L-serine ammonia-lyase [Spirochaetaceae bacterium]|nr:MAG: L-serine ammonia-lyase [Spirochaetaceae bacterium]